MSGDAAPERAVRLHKLMARAGCGSLRVVFVGGFCEQPPLEMLETLEFIRSLKLDKFAFFLSTPYPGTALWQTLESQGRLHDVGCRAQNLGR